MTSRHHCALHLNLVLHMLVVRMQLADTSCTLGGLRPLVKMALAEEHMRQARPNSAWATARWWGY